MASVGMRKAAFAFAKMFAFIRGAPVDDGARCRSGLILVNVQLPSIPGRPT